MTFKIALSIPGSAITFPQKPEAASQPLFFGWLDKTLPLNPNDEMVDTESIRFPFEHSNALPLFFTLEPAGRSR